MVLAHKVLKRTMTGSTSSFRHFSRLPAELQLKIWEATGASAPSMHAFDVCFPSWRGHQRSEKAFASQPQGGIKDRDKRRWSKYKDTVFLDALDTTTEELARPTRVARHRVDPSMYRLKDTLRATCVDAANVSSLKASTPDTTTHSEERNTVYLPGPDRYIHYNNMIDVLHLRFRDGGAATTLSQETLFNAPDPALEPDSSVTPQTNEQSTDSAQSYQNSGDIYSNGISAVLGSLWSSEMADTMHNARRIALDVTETWTESSTVSLIIEEIAFLACTMQHNLEVLYLVDYCVGRCTRCGRQNIVADELQTRGKELHRELQDSSEEEAARSPDVIHGLGKTYHEVFDLEKMGWSDQHPTYIFARIIGEAIRGQQEESTTGKQTFKGVRILAAKDEELPGVDTSMVVDCDHEGALDYPEGKVWGVSSLAVAL